MLVAIVVVDRLLGLVTLFTCLSSYFLCLIFRNTADVRVDYNDKFFFTMKRYEKVNKEARLKLAITKEN